MTTNAIDRFIGARLREQRERRRLSLDDVSRVLNVQPDEVTCFEDGTQRISAQQIQVLCQILDMDPAALFEGLSGEDDRTDDRDQFYNG